MEINEEFNYNFTPITRDITAGLTNQVIEIHGERIYYDEGTAELTVKLRSSNEPGIPLRPKEDIVAPFKKFIITAPATAETIRLIISNPAEVKKEGKEVNVDTVNTVESITNFPEFTVPFIVRTTITSSINLVINNPSTSASFISLINMGISTVYIGTISVTPANGYPLYPGAKIEMPVALLKGAIYGICESGESSVVSAFYIRQ